MHEYSVARSILSHVEKAAVGHGNKQLVTIHLKLGKFSGVEIGLLNTAFANLKEQTVASSAELQIETLPLTLHCTACQEQSTLETFSLRCAHCQSLQTEVLQGREMYISELDFLTERTI